MIPGPTPIPTRVLAAMNRDMIGHRGPLFSSVMRDVLEKMKWAYQTKNEVFLYPCSGTGGMEAAVANTLSPGDKVVVLNIGNFGGRFVKICKAFGVDVNDVKFERGKPADPKVLAEILEKDVKQEIKAVLFQFNETSTGVLNDVEALAKTVRKSHPNSLIIVDAVSGLMAAPLKTDEWDLDVVVSGSQKAFMTPPGIAALAISPRAFEAYKVSKCSKHYFDFALMKDEAPKGHTYTTPPESLIFGLQEGLTMLQEEGMENVFARHKRNRDLVRAASRALGLGLLADDSHASPAVTAIIAPPEFDGEVIRKHMREDYGVEVAPGQSELVKRIFRIGHLGYVDALDLISAFAALEILFKKNGVKANYGAGVKAAMDVLAQD